MRKSEKIKMQILPVGVFLLMFIFLLKSAVGEQKDYTIGAKTSKLAPAQTEYIVYKTDENIVIDGRLNENIWREVPSVTFYGITDGSAPPFLTEGKVIWDDKYLYVGFYFERYDISCYWPIRDGSLPEEIKKGLFPNRSELSPWVQTESLIMTMDSFAKIFIDPDGDGSNYVEFHISPCNNLFDAWYKQGFTNDLWGNRDRFPDVAWRCQGFLSAVHIDGTLNAPHDTDRGWSIEVAIPWKALEPFTSGDCPPKSGDIWGSHLGRVYRDRKGGENQYWVWPFLGVKNCHLPDRYAKIIFKDNLPKFNRLFAFSAVYDEEFVKKAAEIGVTDVAGPPSEKFIALYNKYNINYYPIITINPGLWNSAFPDEEPPMQKLSEEQEAIKKFLKGEVFKRYEPEYRNKIEKPENWKVTEKQIKAIEKMERENNSLQGVYQWGGEPEKNLFTKKYNKEVLVSDLLCFHNPKVLEALKIKIKEYMKLEGIAGISFDAIGYQNYYDCHCPDSLKLYNDYCIRNKIEPDEQRWQEFSLQSLVEFNNALVDYVHSLNPKAKTFNHIWPVYLPEPLYGNRLKMDYCGQTAAWYFYWDPLRIEQYSEVIKKDEKKYWKDVNGVAFIGYYDSIKRPRFPYKSQEKVESELRAILKGGSRMLMVCGLNDVLNNPDISAVFKKFMQKRQAVKNK